MLTFNSLDYPYPSRRNVTIARNGMVATSQPLAADAGLEILKKGGNAVDAAVATAACLTVVEPTSNGIGGDAFALFWFQGKMYGLNASGPSPKRLEGEELIEKGYQKVPPYGTIPVTVPGAPSAWVALNQSFGRLPLEEVMAPAVRIAREGYPVSPVLGKYWQEGFEKYSEHGKDEAFSEWFRIFAPNGRAPRIGEMWHSPDHADTLQKIAETGGAAFYRGEIAEKVDHFFSKYGGYLRGDDLENYRPEWVDPINVHYHDFDVWELPPNGQGIIALMALNMIKEDIMASGDVLNSCHRQIEATKLAFADGFAHVTEPKFMTVSPEDLLTEAYAVSRKNLIRDGAVVAEPGRPQDGGTVYLAAADGDGNMVSFIQSNYLGFGSGIVLPETGVAFQNRGYGFSLDREHVNFLVPGKKTFHTIIPGFLTRGGRPVGPFGVMGGHMQPQGHLQVLINAINFGLNPQSALDAPRWLWTSGRRVKVEHSFPGHLAEGLKRKGHEIEISLDEKGFGRGQIIWRDPNSGVLFGGTEPRTDGNIACY